MTTLDWDAWRLAYDSLSFAEQQHFYQLVAEYHPEQNSFQVQVVYDAFDKIAGSDLRVVEMGGWDGLLAALMLGRGDVASWVNYDLVQIQQRCAHPGYEYRVLEGYLWDQGPISADVFLASHTIEHITGAQLEQLVAQLDVAYVYLESPLPLDRRRSWLGYPGSHIMELTWNEVEALLARYGYHWAEVANLWQR